jgi:outer membrane protein W
VACRIFAVAALVTLLPGAGGVRAQSLEVLDAGKPVSGMQVLTILDDGKPAALGVTGADGTVSVDMSATDFAVGEEIGAWVQVCEDGEEVLILVRRGDPIPEDEDCDDPVLIGYFPWGGEGTLTVDIGDRDVGYDRMARGTPGDWAAYGEANFIVKNFFEIDDVSGGDADSKVDGFGGFFGFKYRDRVALGLSAEYAPGGDFDNAETGITGDIDYLSVNLVGRYFLTRSRFQPYFQAGYGYARNSGEFIRNGETLDDTHETGIANFGGGARYWVNDRFGLKAAAGYYTVFDESADNSWSYELGAVFQKRFGRPKPVF